MARNPGRWTVLEGGLYLTVVLIAAMTAEVCGQVVAKPKKTPAPAVPARQSDRSPSGASSDEDLSENVFLPADRKTLQKLAESRKALTEGRVGQAVRYVGDVLEGPEDYFFQPEKGSPIYRSLKAEAQRLIGQMPREGRELYELRYGARARRMLEEAVQSGDMAPLAEVSRRFFHTRSGYQATFLLGLHHFDHGRPLAGALTLQRLQDVGPHAEELEPTLSLTMAACWVQAGMSEKAREVLISLRQRYPKLRVTAPGREIPIFTNDAEAVGWLVGLIGSYTAAAPSEADRWLMFRGDAARNAATAGSAPILNVRWQVPVADDPVMQAALEQYRRQRAEQEIPSIPALHPLAVADVLLMRTARNLLAVDCATGKRLWEVPEDSAAELAPGVPAADAQMRQTMLLSGIGQRMWGDMTYGTLSSDGRHVFSVEDLDLAFGPGGGMLFRLGAAGRNVRIPGVMAVEETSLANRLAAYEIRTGKLKWDIGGPAGQYALRQAETFFLGPPLPLMGQLYVLGESKGEVRLMVLDGATGNLLWSQQLAVVEQSVLQDPLRRWAGASPSYADGILVCPTSAGAIVGLELTTRSLLWGYRYGQGRTGNRPGIGMQFVSTMTSPSRWTDGAVCIADGRVLVAPTESDSLYCLSLIDGKELWKSARQNDLYVACADRNKVVLVGRHSIRALNAANGKPAWGGRAIDLPAGSMPSGRGFLNGDRYFVPLDSAEVATIDLAAGKTSHVAKSRKGNIPGNLICYEGKVISQGADSVDAYYQLDAVQAEVARRLAANPDDAEALSLRGETLLDAGKRADAVVSLRRAYGLEPDPRTRELLRDSLMDGLRTEFPAYRNHNREIERLIDDPAQQVVYLRLMADGLRQAGQWAAAFDYDQKLIDLEPNRRPLDQVSKSLTVRRDRWFQGQMALLRAEATADAAAAIDAVVETRLKAALAAGSIDHLQQFLDYFGNQPAAADARGELIRKLKGAGRLLDAELTARSAGVSQQILSESRAREERVRQQETQDAIWPVGKVEIAKSSTKLRPGLGFGRWIIEMRGDPGPFFSDVSIHFDDSRQTIAASDGLGRELWQTGLAAERQNFAYNRAWAHARAEGHLLLVALGWRVMAIDTLGTGRGGAARLLWAQNLIGSGVEGGDLRVNPPALGNLPWQLQHRFAQSLERSSMLGPISSRYICFQRFRNLVAVDPRSGETLWIRQDVTPGSEVFGDDEYVFVLSPDREEASVLRATDGELLGTRKVPRERNRQSLSDGQEKRTYAQLDKFCLATFGRRMLLWWPEGDERLLTLVDPLEGRDVWPGRAFSTAARASVVGDRAVGVMEPDGRFVLLSLPDGRVIVETRLATEPGLADISLLATGGQYTLITRRSATEVNSPSPIQPIPGCDPKPIYRGRAYALDEHGKLQWPEPVAIRNQFLLLDQPSRLPLITFVSQAFEQKNGQSRQKFSLLCIDRRNGRTAYKGEFVNHAGILDIVGDPAKKTVDLVLQRETIRLTFTDKPLPPPSPADSQADPSSQGTNPAGALWDWMQKMFDSLIGESGQEDDN